MNHPYFRTGIQFVDIGSDIHMGMLSYFSTERFDERGVSFAPSVIGDNVSFGQRCVSLSGVTVGSESTIGAETFVPCDFQLGNGGTAFGSPPVSFKSSMSHQSTVGKFSYHRAQRPAFRSLTLEMPCGKRGLQSLCRERIHPSVLDPTRPTPLLKVIIKCLWRHVDRRTPQCLQHVNDMMIENSRLEECVHPVVHDMGGWPDDVLQLRI